MGVNASQAAQPAPRSYVGGRGPRLPCGSQPPEGSVVHAGTPARPQPLGFWEEQMMISYSLASIMKRLISLLKFDLEEVFKIRIVRKNTGKAHEECGSHS